MWWEVTGFIFLLVLHIVLYSQSMKSVSSRRRQQRKQQTPGDVETDESESDPDQLTSSRTESSNQLDAGKLKHSMRNHLSNSFIK